MDTSFLSNIHEYQLSSFLVDKYFRLYNSIRSRLIALRFQYKIGVDKQILPSDLNNYLNDIGFLEFLFTRLDNNSLICNNDTYYEVQTAFNTLPKTIEDHSNLILGYYFPRRASHRKGLNHLENLVRSGQIDDLTLELLEREKFSVSQYEEFFKILRQRCLAARKADLLNRLFIEMNLRVMQGWFVVFNTLTVDNQNHEEVFGGENSTSWSNYVRSLDRSVGIKLHNSWRNAVKFRKAGSEFHSYFSVVERGSKSGRLHIHCLHFLKALPQGCSDPNAGSGLPYRREIEYLKSFWSFGESHPIAVRFNNSDAYGNLYWRWPVKSEKVEGSNYRKPLDTPIECKPPAAVVFYVGKYLTKEYDKPLQKEVSKWRTKLNRNLGRSLPQAIINHPSITDNHLQLIIRLSHSKMFNLKTVNSLPMSLFRRMAMQKLIKNQSNQNRSRLFDCLMGLKPRTGLLNRVKALTGLERTGKTGICSHTQANSGDVLTIKLNIEVISSLIKIVNECEFQIFGQLSFTSNVRGNSMEVRYV